MRQGCLKIAFGLVVLFAVLANVEAAFITIPITDIATTSIRARIYSAPAGNPVVLGGVEFDMTDALDFHSTGDHRNQVPYQLVFDDLNILSPTKLYMLVNSGWGHEGTRVATIHVLTEDAQEYSIELIEGFNLRDWNDGYNVNTYTSPDLKPVYEDIGKWGRPARIDMLTITLPTSFQGSIVDSLIIDGHETGYEDGILVLQGITFEALAVVPEPATLAMLAVGLGGVVPFLRKRV